MEIRNRRSELNSTVRDIMADLDAEVMAANKRIAYGKLTDTTKDKARMRGYADGLMQAQLIVSKYEGHV